MNAIDQIVGWFSPQRGLQRCMARHAMDLWEQTETNQRIRRSYEGGRLDRTTKAWKAGAEAGDTQSLAEVQRMRWRAWDLWRNNPYVRKGIRTIMSHSVGCGLQPNSQAETKSGMPFTQFREASENLWGQWGKSPLFNESHLGACTDINNLQSQLMMEIAVSGEVLVVFQQLDMLEARKENNPAAIGIEVVSGDRLVEDFFISSTRNQLSEGNFISRGIEYTEKGRRVAYWVNKHHSQDPRIGLNQKFDTIRIPAEQVLHLYIKERPDQQRGITWLAPVILQVKDIRDYQENEMVAAAIGACVSLAIVRNSGRGTVGLNTPSGQDSVDSDDNTITRMQPGQIFDLREGESISGFNPQRPNSNAEIFITHILRSVANGLPGVKSSSITGDYRESTFSSERSADNDIWREVEQNQKWFVCNFCQPTWETVMIGGAAMGFFAGVDKRVFNTETFILNRNRLLQASWDGPVQKSINPKDDEAASAAAIKGGTSSLPVEAASKGKNWRHNMADAAKVIEEGVKLGLPENYTMGVLGIEPEVEKEEPEEPEEPEEEPEDDEVAEDSDDEDEEKSQTNGFNNRLSKV